MAVSRTLRTMLVPLYPPDLSGCLSLPCLFWPCLPAFHAGAAFIACLEVSLAVPQTLPGNKQLRARFIAFLHRMVECLQPAVLPYLPPALEALMGANADALDLADVLALLVQLAMRFKEALGKLVDAALPAAVVKVHTLLGEWDACGIVGVFVCVGWWRLPVLPWWRRARAPCPHAAWQC